MILFDTNVLIDYWRNPTELKKLNISKDKHFKLIQSIYPELELYEPN